MKKSLKKDTLAYQLGVRPGVQLRNMGSVNVKDVIASLNKFMEGSTTGDLVGTKTGEKPMGHPEVDGIIFYMMNHAVSIVRQQYNQYEALGDKLVVLEEYHRQLSYRSARMFFYLLLICTRESRHAKNDHDTKMMQELRKQYGDSIFDFHKSIKGSGSSGAASKLQTSPPDASLGQYTKFLCDVFYKGNYSSGYGGPAWGKVADVLRDYVNGVITAEMMMDTAFTLCHNNGPIFNKGMLFQSYTDEIYKILDVQRSGQIPQMVANGESKWATHSEVKPLWEFCRGHLGAKFEGHVDWFLVEELGALKTYTSQKNAQVAAHGYPEKMKAKQMAEKVKQDLAAKKAKEDEGMWVQIMPNAKVKKVEVKR